MSRDQPGVPDDDPRPYAPPPTPRTYIADAWLTPARRREVLDHLATEYDWYLDRMVPAKLRDLGWSSEVEAERCAIEVKRRFLLPDDEAISGPPDSFWLGRWKREQGPLRHYFRTCIRNFIRDWCAAHRNEKRRVQPNHPNFPDGTGLNDGHAAPDAPSFEPTPAEIAEQREFEARYDKHLFLRMAMRAYGDECGENSSRWRAYRLFAESWPLPAPREVAEKLGLTPDEANNHIHRGRVRIQELLWWFVRVLEIDDGSADRAMLALVGRLPACRRGNILPKPPRADLDISS